MRFSCFTWRLEGKIDRPLRRGVFFRWLDRGGVAVLGAAVALAFKQ